MNYGSGMIWPLAAEYARHGWAVRRAGWSVAETLGDTGRALRWIVYQNALFWLVYRAPSFDGNKMTRVCRNTDFTVEEFYAEDWTVLSPECFGDLGGESVHGAEWQQGKKPYPRGAGSSPVVDPLYPNAVHGTCPIVPLYADIRRPIQPSNT